MPNGDRKPNAATRLWIELYSAAPWYTTVEDSGADAILRIWTPGGKDPRARKVVHRGGGGRRYKFSSQKVGRMIHCESKIEFGFCNLLEIDPDVSGFCEQPMQVHYRINGETHFHIPDSLVNRKDRVSVLECKEKVKLDDPQLAARTELLSRCLPKLGFEYRVVTEDAICEPRLQNAKDVCYVGRYPVDASTRDRILKLVDSDVPVTWGGAITGQLGPRGQGALLRMVRDGDLWFDIDRVRLPSTPFLRRTGDLKWNF
jgi:hypothetical protein